MPACTNSPSSFCRVVVVRPSGRGDSLSLSLLPTPFFLLKPKSSPSFLRILPTTRYEEEEAYYKHTCRGFRFIREGLNIRAHPCIRGENYFHKPNSFSTFFHAHRFVANVHLPRSSPSPPSFRESCSSPVEISSLLLSHVLVESSDPFYSPLSVRPDQSTKNQNRRRRLQHTVGFLASPSSSSFSEAAAIPMAAPSGTHTTKQKLYNNNINSSSSLGHSFHNNSYTYSRNVVVVVGFGLLPAEEPGRSQG